jgi:peptidoglycan-associated lipoprotein
MFKKFSCFAMAVILTAAVCGCKSDAPAEDLSAVPRAVADPTGGYYDADLGASGSEFGIGSGVNDGSWVDADAAGAIGNADADGWVEADPSGNRLNMPIIYFKYDSDELVEAARTNLDRIASFVADKEKLGLVIEGHCDQRGTEEYNRALGERRANAVRAYLVSRGVADAKIKTVSYGKDMPAVEGSGETVWSQNRRAVPVPMIIP